MKRALFFLLATTYAHAGLINPDGFLWLPNLSLNGEFGDSHDLQDVQFDQGGNHYRDLVSQGQNGSGNMEIYLPASRYLTLHGGFGFGKSVQGVDGWNHSPYGGRNADYNYLESHGSSNFFGGARVYPFEIHPAGPAVWGLNANPSGRYWRPSIGLNWNTDADTEDITLSTPSNSSVGTGRIHEGHTGYAIRISMPFSQFNLETSYLKDYQRSRDTSSSGGVTVGGFSGTDEGSLESYQVTLKAYLYDLSKLPSNLPDWNPDGVIDEFSVSVWAGWSRVAGQWNGNAAGVTGGFPVSSYLTAWGGASYSTFPLHDRPSPGISNLVTASSNASSTQVTLGLNLYLPDHDPQEEENPAYVAK